jgi:hypothetical protein
MPRNNGEDMLSHRITIYIIYGTFGKSENNAYLKKTTFKRPSKWLWNWKVRDDIDQHKGAFKFVSYFFFSSFHVYVYVYVGP